ncbi:Cof-type HAD-IIB family hydrolase [Levilactobacillus suantsaii]|uniref:HAD family phosphatase n=1 Tax=Levilactobacillus suantsaii TaxID=2292255 RepID=A0A4Q0VJ53_9LACO|nr:Cof-type HAD-IIB family hydrolase [Levilactobacillus suantsaii]QMU07729.1 HAD family phosphatase [Levilactobacillus suantsaii]RXI79358.1 HAD family phosphatase [Levilactobacillus suantsaii]
MERKLIAIDLDGTTLNKQSQVSPKTKAVLTAARQAGHLVSIVTGRPNRLSANIYDDLNLDGPMINFNGSLGHIPHHEWAGEYQYTFDRGIAFDLLAHRAELGIQMIAAEGKHLFLAMQDQPRQIGFFPSVLQSNQILNQKSLTQNPTSLTIAVDRSHQDQLLSYLRHNFNDQIDAAPWGGPDSVVELGAKGIQKATGVEVLAHHYHVQRANIIAFGDEHNDRAMIDYAGWGVAMQNATPAIKQLANDVTAVDNDHDGLANYLADYLHLDVAE